jgi:Fe-S-cluster containining protein
MDETLRAAVRDASARPEVAAAIQALYADVQSAVDARRPACVVSGKCCRFEEYGHRLYVTSLELAAFVRQLAAGTSTEGWDGTGCPFQRARLCTVHAIRPFGCRMFFCDATSTEWQNEAYERFHARIQQLHADLNVPYFYVEWRGALRALGLAPGAVSNTESSF